MRNIKKTAVVGGTVAALMGAGIAFAAWTSTGTGSGSATAGSDQGLTVTGGTTVTGLFPTGSKDVTVTVTNNNDYKAVMDTITAGATTVTGNTGTCTATVVSTVDKSGLTDVLDAAGGANDSVDYTFAFSMTNSAEDGCQGATFSIPFTATGHSSN